MKQLRPRERPQPDLKYRLVIRRYHLGGWPTLSVSVVPLTTKQRNHNTSSYTRVQPTPLRASDCRVFQPLGVAVRIHRRLAVLVGPPRAASLIIVGERCGRASSPVPKSPQALALALRLGCSRMAPVKRRSTVRECGERARHLSGEAKATLAPRFLPDNGCRTETHVIRGTPYISVNSPALWQYRVHKGKLPPPKRQRGLRNGAARRQARR